MNTYIVEPCPQCGNKDVRLTNGEPWVANGKKFDTYHFQCAQCGTRGYAGDSPKQAATLWSCLTKIKARYGKNV